MKLTMLALTAALLALPALAAAQSAPAPVVRYHVVALPEVPSPGGCTPTAVNDNGDAVGYCGGGTGLSATPVSWIGGVVTDLGKLTAGTYVNPWAISNVRQIVGAGDNGNLDPKAAVLTATGWLAIDLTGGSVQQARGVTDAGVVFGNFTKQGQVGTTDWDPVYWTFDPKANKYSRTLLPFPPAQPGSNVTGAFIYGATKLGIAVGDMASDLIGNMAGFWDNDTAHTITVFANPPGFPSAGGRGISDDKRAVGFAFDGSVNHAVLWQNDAAHTPVDLGTLPGDSNSHAYGVNTTGQIVGISEDPATGTQRGFLHQNGAMYGLSSLIDPADGAWSIVNAVGINNNGVILAEGFLGTRRPVMLVPFTPAPIASVSLSADRTAPQQPGTTITFTAGAAGGMAPYEYKWWLYDGTSWTMLQDWTGAATFAWTPATASNQYSIQVWARTADSPVNGAEKAMGMNFPIHATLGSITLTADHVAPQAPGTAITLTAGATGGTAPYQYKWWLYNGTTWTILQDWSSAPTYAWTPSAANGQYSLQVWGRSAGSTLDVAEKATGLNFPILANPITAVTVTADRVAPQAPGTTVTFTAAATGGTAPYQYEWWLYNGATWTMLQAWSTSATWAWTPATTGQYSVQVWVRSAGSTATGAEKANGMNFPIGTASVITAVTVSADHVAPQAPGTSITFTAAGTGGAAPYQYKWWLFNGTTWTMLQDWSTSSTFVWTPAAASSQYSVQVWARSAGASADAAEKAMGMNFPIQ
jgi:probable HAF family extracellular repeat protein